MKLGKIVGILLIAVGVVLVGVSYYIKQQVASGAIQLANAEKTVNQGKRLFSLNPVSEQVGGVLTKSADKKISQGRADIAYYTNLAQTLQIGGFALIVIGAFILVISMRKKSS